MGIDLGCSNIRMAEHDLNRTEIGTIFEEVSSEGVAQGLGRDLLVYAAGENSLLDYLPETEPGHWSGPIGDEQEITTLFFDN